MHVHLLFERSLDLGEQSQVCNNIFVIQKLDGQFVGNQCFYHLYFLIHLLSISNTKRPHSLKEVMEVISLGSYWFTLGRELLQVK